LVIDVQHGLAWLRTLPEPNINLARAPRAVAGAKTRSKRRTTCRQSIKVKAP